MTLLTLTQPGFFKAVASLQDRRYIETEMEEGSIFPHIVSPVRRFSILGEVLSIPYMLTFIHAFFEDANYLEPCSKILKYLLPSGSKNIISQTLDDLDRLVSGSSWRRTDQVGEYVKHLKQA